MSTADPLSYQSNATHIELSFPVTHNASWTSTANGSVISAVGNASSVLTASLHKSQATTVPSHTSPAQRLSTLQALWNISQLWGNVTSSLSTGSGLTTSGVSAGSSCSLWSQSLAQLTVVITCLLGTVSIFANVLVLVASKFTGGGKTSTLIFVRSLCVADTFAGVFAVIKTVYVFTAPKCILINCFLGESILFSSVLASNFTLMALTVDCFMKLLDPMDHEQHMDKRMTITMLVFLWNGAFVVGFAPQMGWNVPDMAFNLTESMLGLAERKHVCSFFEYYHSYYLIFISCLFGLCIVGLIGLHMWVHVVAAKIATNSYGMNISSLEFKKTMRLIVTTRVDLVSQILCYSPAVVYILLHCQICVFYTASSSSSHLTFFMPLILVKSFLSAVLHGSRTTQIRQVMCNFWDTFVYMCCIDRVCGMLRRLCSHHGQLPHGSQIQTVAQQVPPKESVLPAGTNSDAHITFSNFTNTSRGSVNRAYVGSSIDTLDHFQSSAYNSRITGLISQHTKSLHYAHHTMPLCNALPSNHT